MQNSQIPQEKSEVGASGVDVTGASGGMGAGLDMVSIDYSSFECLAYRS